jgi:hypothetical protein
VSAASAGRIRPLPARNRDRAQIEDERGIRVRPQDIDAPEHEGSRHGRFEQLVATVEVATANLGAWD